MKPLRIFIFFLAVTLLLLCLALVFPREGILISEDIQLDFASFSDLQDLRGSDPDARVDSLLALSTVTEDPEADFIFTGIRNQRDSVQDSLRRDSLLNHVDPANTDSLRKARNPIQFPAGGAAVLAPFFQDLGELAQGSTPRARIMHYGDSQIEMDRMSALIRYRLQKQFGGSGCGLVQAIPLYTGHPAYVQEEEGEWLRYTYFGKRDSTIRHNTYGAMAAFSSVAPPEEDLWPALHYKFNKARRTGRVDRVRVFLHSYAEGGSVAMLVNDSISDTIVNLAGGYNMTEFRHMEEISSLSLHLALPEGGRIYGLSFESYRGLQMDNIAMRGSAGLLFSKLNRQQLMKMMEHLAPDLLILQFGGNVVPYINANFYKRTFTRELKAISYLCPDVPVIVIGPADMSTKDKGRFVSYPGVEPVRDALKNAALENGCAFWDMYEAMGGQNSMPSFVHSDPPLASSDYVHFTSLGVNLVAEMFYNALMQEYAAYLKREDAL